MTRRKEAQAEILHEKMQEEDELRKEIAEKKKIMEKEFGSAPMNEQQFKGKKDTYFFDAVRFGAVNGLKSYYFLKQLNLKLN